MFLDFFWFWSAAELASQSLKELWSDLSYQRSMFLKNAQWPEALKPGLAVSPTTSFQRRLQGILERGVGNGVRVCGRSALAPRALWRILSALGVWPVCMSIRVVRTTSNLFFHLYTLTEKSKGKRSLKVREEWQGKVPLPHILIFPWIKKGPLVYISQLLPPSPQVNPLAPVELLVWLLIITSTYTDTGKSSQWNKWPENYRVWLCLLPLPNNLTLDPELNSCSVNAYWIDLILDTGKTVLELFLEEGADITEWNPQRVVVMPRYSSGWD